jgi:hypothetical protein
MDSNRLFATLIIWLATAGIFLGGLLQISWVGWEGGVPWAAATAALFLGAGHATKHVWASTSRPREALHADAAHDAV